MNIYIVLGSGNSGAGAIHDYLSSREDCIAPFKGAEFRFVNDPNGIDDLYNNLYENFSINKSSNSIYEFQCTIARSIQFLLLSLMLLSDDSCRSIRRLHSCFLGDRTETGRDPC